MSSIPRPPRPPQTLGSNGTAMWPSFPPQERSPPRARLARLGGVEERERQSKTVIFRCHGRFPYVWDRTLQNADLACPPESYFNTQTSGNSSPPLGADQIHHMAVRALWDLGFFGYFVGTTCLFLHQTNIPSLNLAFPGRESPPTPASLENIVSSLNGRNKTPPPPPTRMTETSNPGTCLNPNRHDIDTPRNKVLAAPGNESLLLRKRSLGCRIRANQPVKANKTFKTNKKRPSNLGENVLNAFDCRLGDAKTSAI